MNAGLIDNDTRIDDIVVLDEAGKEANLCEADKKYHCGNEQQYLITTKCCGEQFKICEDCLFKEVELIKKFILVDCGACHKTFFMPKYSEYAIVTPLS